MSKKLETLVYATTCAKGYFYSKYKNKPIDIEQISYDNKEIKLRAYGEKENITVIFDIAFNRITKVIDNTKEKITTIDNKGSIFDLSQIIGLTKENENKIKFIKKDNNSINGMFIYIHEYDNGEYRDKWFEIIKNKIIGG